MSVPAPILQYTLSDATMKGLLPAGYTPLAYIESSGTLYIDTGITPNCNRLQITSKVTIINNDTYGNLFGSVGDNNGGRPGIRLYINLDKSLYVLSKDNLEFLLNNVKLNTFNIYLDLLNNSSSTIKINDNTATITSNINLDNNILLFAINLGNSPVLNGYGTLKMYSFNAVKNNILAVELIPAKRDSDGAIGMYDLVSRTFKTNSGSGSFIAGPELAVGKGGGKSLPEEYLLVEYIRIPGGDGINTGVTVTSGTKFVAEHVMTFQQLSSNSRDVSGYNGGASGYWEVGNGNKYGTYTTYSITAGTRDKIVFTKTAEDGGNLVVNGTTSHSCGDGRTGTYTIGGVNGSYGGSRWKDVEYIKIWSADVLVRNMYACYRKSDMKPGMYDVVNGVFYTNSGSGEFVLGPSITNCYTWEPNAGSGTLQGLYTNVSGIYDSSKGWVADFSTSSVEMPGLLTLLGTSTSFSFAIWFKRSSGGGWNTIWGCNGFELEAARSGNNQVVAYNWGQSSSGGITYTLGEWHHLVMTRNTSESKFYLDGELKYTGSPHNIPNTALFLGAWKQHGSQSYLGQMTNMMLFNTVLTAAQVKELYGQ